MLLQDRLTLGKPIRTKEGFLAVRAKAARAGVYDYLGVEVDPKGEHFRPEQVVKVYRPADEVFDKTAVGSFFAKPITDNHPRTPVTKDNWRDHARGAVMGALRDGEYLAFDLTLMDAGAIETVDSGKSQLSNGYDCDLSFEDGVAPDGTAYQAVQRKIRGNHVAIVDVARAGSECRIVDGIALCDDLPIDQLVAMMADRRKPNDARPLSSPQDQSRIPNMPHTLIIDGLQVTEVSDQAKAAIEKLQGQVTSVTAAKDSAEAKVAEHVTTLSAKDAEIATLKQAVADAKVTPAQLRDAAKAYDKLVADAKKLAPALAITDSMDEAAIKKAVVSAKLGDAAAAFTDAQFDVSFSTLVATAGSAAPVQDGLRAVIASGPANVGDAATDYAKARDAAKDAISSAWKTPATPAVAA